MNDQQPNPVAHERSASNRVRVRRLGLDTQYEAVVFMHKECQVCRSEGFSAHARVLLRNGKRQVIATLYQATGDLIAHDEAALSESAWTRLGISEGDLITIAHPAPLESLSHVRSRIYGHDLNGSSLRAIIQDIVDGKYSDIHLSSFLTACASRPLGNKEVLALTQAMVDVGERLHWPAGTVVDKHCAGGLPGNRTTPIIVAIAASLGLIMPKTSSRAITSPAGTADAMETMAPVELDTATIRRVVEREGGCVVWGGAVNLSPADDILIRVERALDLDTEGQLIASVLSKKIAAGSTHLVIDLPIGPTAKVRNRETAEILSRSLVNVGEAFGLQLKVMLTDGSQPIGRGIGPALEARDVLSVLQRKPTAPGDLRHRAILLSGALIELAGIAAEGCGEAMAASVLDDGRAWMKFQAICEAQGGMRMPPKSHLQQPFLAERPGRVRAIDNRKISRLAKLAGAPDEKAAGVDLHVTVGDLVDAGQPLCTVHANAPGELAYAFDYAAANRDLISIDVS
ncbi:MAG TPA: thymidine phosphorylase family protein [Xanthobacteraceae bacterium]|jgi:thymidine phosphorylase|nr:thymidine phosphorylase family protein [Xanthobacteraceae bacterium]